jgi:hypothetical protein
MFSRLLAAVGVRTGADDASAGAINATAAKPVAPPHVPALEPAVAVREFLDDLIDYADGDEFPFAKLSQWYALGRVDCPHRWPPLSAMALSRHLVALGCRRRQADLRHRGLGRPTFIRLPRMAPALAVVPKLEKGRVAA